MLRLTGLQDGGEGYPAVGQVLAHAEEEAVQVVTQLDGLADENSERIVKTGFTMHISKEHVSLSNRAVLPDFEVGENQLTSRESYLVSTPASVGRPSDEFKYKAAPLSHIHTL